jgi:hypothetical protein
VNVAIAAPGEMGGAIARALAALERFCRGR